MNKAKAIRLGGISIAALMSLTSCATDGIGPSAFMGQKGGSSAIPDKPLLQSLNNGGLSRPESYGALPTRPRELVNDTNIAELPEFDALSADIVQKLLAGVNGKKPDVRVYVTIEQNIDARAPSANEIYITKPVITTARTEGDLAFIIGHELSHALLGHYERGEAIAKRKETIGTMTGVALLAASLAGAKMQGSGSNRTITLASTRKSQRFMGKSAAMGLLMTELTDTIVNPGWSRMQERQADKMSVDLMIEAGYEIDTIPNLLLDLRQKEQDYYEGTKAMMAAVVPVMASVGISSLMGQGGDMKSTLFGMAKVVGVQSYMDWRERQNNAFHDDPEKRSDDLFKYASALHGIGNDEGDLFTEDDTAEAPKADRLVTLKRTGGMFAQAMTNYDAGYKAKVAFSKDEFKTARSEAKKATTFPTTRALYPTMINYSLALYDGKPDAVRKNAKLAMASNYATPYVFSEYAHYEANMGEAERANAVLADGEEKFGTAEPFYVAKLVVTAIGNDWERYEEAFSACTESGRVATKQKCRDVNTSLGNKGNSKPAGKSALQNPFGSLFKSK